MAKLISKALQIVYLIYFINKTKGITMITRIDDLQNYMKNTLNDSYHNLSVLTGISIERLREIVEDRKEITSEEENLIDRLIY